MPTLKLTWQDRSDARAARSQLSITDRATVEDCYRTVRRRGGRSVSALLMAESGRHYRLGKFRSMRRARLACEKHARWLFAA